MNFRSWNDVKTYLCKLISQVSAIYGGENINQLNAYIDDVIKLYRQDLKTPIACFEALIQQAKDCGWIRQNGSVLTPYTVTGRHPLKPKSPQPSSEEAPLN